MCFGNRGKFIIKINNYNFQHGLCQRFEVKKNAIQGHEECFFAYMCYWIQIHHKN
jgi:hypothetical protein